MPNPPASLTAAASAGVVMPPTGACTIGRSIPTKRQNAVSKRRVMAGLFLIWPVECSPKPEILQVQVRLRAKHTDKVSVSC
jgi:hypothetical protein